MVCLPSLAVPAVADGAGDPVQMAGVVPGTDDACCGEEHALSKTTLVTAPRADRVTTTLRRPASVGIARA